MRKSSLVLAGLLATAALPAAAQSTPATLTYTQPLSPQAVELVQQRLRQQGEYNGSTDGVWGADSQSALERFQHSHGLQVTGQLNQATVATLGISPDQLLAAPPPVPAAPVAGSTLSPSAVQAIQSRLRALNYYNGPIDGIWGGETQSAVERFQQGRGFQPNGELDAATASALGLDPKILASSP